MTPSMAVEISARRRQLGVLTADWQQRPLKHISSLDQYVEGSDNRKRVVLAAAFATVM